MLGAYMFLYHICKIQTCIIFFLWIFTLQFQFQFNISIIGIVHTWDVKHFEHANHEYIWIISKTCLHHKLINLTITWKFIFIWNVIKLFRWDKPLIKDKVESHRVKLYMGNASKLNGGKGGVGGVAGGRCAIFVTS